MKCPQCECAHVPVIDSKAYPTPDISLGAGKEPITDALGINLRLRRKRCANCGYTFTTVEFPLATLYEAAQSLDKREAVEVIKTWLHD